MINFTKLANAIIKLIGTKLKVKPEVVIALVASIPEIVDFFDEFMDGLPGTVKFQAARAELKAKIAEMVDDVESVFPATWALLSPAVNTWVLLKRLGLVKAIGKVL